MSTAEATTGRSRRRGWSPRVLFSADIFTRQRSGGISRYHSELFRGLRTLGVEAHVVLGPRGHPFFPARSPGISYVPRLIPGRFACKAGEVWTQFSLIRRAGSIFHPTYYTARRRGCSPAVITFHDLIHLKGLTEDPETEAVVQGQRFWATAADAVIAVSEHTAKDLVDLLAVPRSKIRVVHLGVKPPISPPSENRCSQPTLLFVGHRQGYKNWASCVRALGHSTLREWRMVCVGGASPSREEMNLLAGEGVASRVRFVAGADDRALNDWLQSATALVYPSTYEGFGLPPLEAMVRGTPVIAANRASIPEICGDAVLYVEPDPDSLIAGISQLSDDRTRADLSRRGLARAQQFTWERTTTQTLELYEELA